MTVTGGGTLAGTGVIVSSVGVDIASGGILAPGMPGTAGGKLTITGGVSLASGADYLEAIDGASASETTISGTATLGGAAVTIASGSTVTAGTTYTILGAAALSGTFNPSVTSGGLVGAISYVADDVDLMFALPCYSGPFPYKNTGTVSGICAANTIFSGNASIAGIVNTGLVSSSGITLKSTTITGSIVDSGTLFGGISIDSASKVEATSAGTRRYLDHRAEIFRRHIERRTVRIGTRYRRLLYWRHQFRWRHNQCRNDHRRPMPAS